jgi:hypothetical protein
VDSKCEHKAGQALLSLSCRPHNKRMQRTRVMDKFVLRSEHRRVADARRYAHAIALHVVWGIPQGHASPAVLVTAYRPDATRWSADFTRRLK